jgi:hypothetical protein
MHSLLTPSPEGIYGALKLRKYKTQAYRNVENRAIPKVKRVKK